jgi:hypothetical protein
LGCKKKLYACRPKSGPQQIQTQRIRRKQRTEPCDPASLERAVRQLLAEKISGNQVGIWLLASEHLRLGTWDLLCAWSQSGGQRLWPRMALHLVHETAFCVLDSKSLLLTANDNTPYTLVTLDLADGPLVVEVPPMVLGPLDDAWFRWVTDVDVLLLCYRITPAMTEKMVGQGSQYAGAFVDAKGDPLDGAKTYKLHLPADVPAKDFWSFVVYDNQTRSMLQTDQQYPSTSSQKKGLQINEDKSVDVWFGPQAPSGHESNWVQTVPGKGWNVLLRLYGPLEP